MSHTLFSYPPIGYKRTVQITTRIVCNVKDPDHSISLVVWDNGVLDLGVEMSKDRGVYTLPSNWTAV